MNAAAIKTDLPRSFRGTGEAIGSNRKSIAIGM
jgi:hypothetical protein